MQDSLNEISIPLEYLWNSNKAKLPANAQTMLRRVREVLQGKDVEKLLVECGIFSTDDKRKVTLVYQGSYNENTANDYFRIIPKSDIDLLMVIGGFTQTIECIISNPEGNKKLSDWIDPLHPNYKNMVGLYSEFVTRCYQLNYVEIFKFENFKNRLSYLLEEKFANIYKVENKTKVIKISLNDSEKAYSVEVAICGKLQLGFILTDFNERDKLNKLKNENLISLVENNYFLNGFNIITSKKIPRNRSNYYEEIPNFSNFNLYNLNLKNNSTKGLFKKYVVCFKNFIKIWNEKNIEFQIDISSFHIESILYNLDQNNFIKEVDEKNLETIAKKARDLVKEKYVDIKEINEIYLLSRNTTHKEIIVAMNRLVEAIQFEYN